MHTEAFSHLGSWSGADAPLARRPRTIRMCSVDARSREHLYSLRCDRSWKERTATYKKAFPFPWSSYSNEERKECQALSFFCRWKICMQISDFSSERHTTRILLK